jgi:hypothetical protein
MPKKAEKKAEEAKQTQGVDTAKGQDKSIVTMFKVSKISINPSRKVNLGNFSTVDLNMGMEVVFEKPVEINSQEVQDALKEMREVVGKEMKEQYVALSPKKPATDKNKEAGKK